jgi:hypothetical protein
MNRIVTSPLSVAPQRETTAGSERPNIPTNQETRPTTRDPTMAERKERKWKPGTTIAAR